MRYVAIFEYNTEADNSPVPEDMPGPITIHGPFESEAAALDWLNAQPDDTDVRDCVAAPLNDPADREPSWCGPGPCQCQGTFTVADE